MDTQDASGLEVGGMGRVIGQAATTYSDDGWRVFGFVWDPGSGLHDLGGGFMPVSVNAQGLVGGNDTTKENHWRAFLWEPDTGVRDVGVPPDWTRFEMLTMNDAGQFIGTAGAGGEDPEDDPDVLGTRGYLWDPTSGWTGFGRSSGVVDFNNAGQLLLTVMEQDYLWDPTTGKRVNVAADQAYDVMEVHDLNDQGQVVGVAEYGLGFRAFVWSERDGLADLGTLPGAESSAALGINNKGQVVGYSWGTSGTTAFVWDPQAGMRGLGTLAEPDDSMAVGINDASQIVGISGPEAVGGVGSVVIWVPESVS